MKKILYLHYRWLLLLLLFVGFMPVLLAQNPGVLQLQQNSFNTYFDTGIELKTDLLDTGNSGEATLEFWVKSSQASNQWILSDLNADNAHFALSMASENQLSLSLGTTSYITDLTGVVSSNLWHHIALVISQGGQLVELYVNGVKYGHYNLDISGNRELYFYKDATAELFITEIRGWSKRRTPQDISDNQWRSFITQSSTELTSLKNNEGLAVFYGDDDHQTTSPIAGIGELDHVGWKNIQSGIYSSGVVSAYNGQTLAAVRGDTDHPVFNLDQILVSASKGGFSDKVQLQWLHIVGADGYNIFRDDVLIANEPAPGLSVSDLILYDDPDILPADLHNYKVEAYSNSDTGFSVEGSDQGFIFPNGEISGNIATQSSVFVEGVQLRATGTSPTGNALEFNPVDGPLTVSNIELFRNLSAFSVEFWHQGDSGTPFQLGGTSISFAGGNINVTNGDGSAYISAAAPGDGGWHHYSVVFSPSGGFLYIDTVEAVSNTTAFSINLGNENSFTLNASSPSAAYRLDELRMWSTALDSTAVASRYDHILSGSEQELALYYRFDIGDAQKIYNQADVSKGNYIGESASALNWLSAPDQPSGLVYGAYTDANGNYTIASINAGTAASGLDMTITPSKPNHTFNPAEMGLNIKRSLTTSDYEKQADFTDISSLAIAGKVLYDEGGTEYPVPAGAAFTLDGQLILGADPGLTTDAFGVFSLSAPLGLHELAVDNPLVSASMGTQSLYFDGLDDYADSEKVIDFQRDGIFSGWIKRDTASATLQTILQIGDLRVVLKDNQHLAVMEGPTEVITAADQLGDDWHFFALSYNQTTKEAVLYSGTSFYQNTLTNPNLNAKLVLGATLDPSASAFYQGNMHLVEYRDSLYDAALVTALRLGDYIEGDDNALWFSFSFTESAGELLRTVSIAPGAEDYVLQCNGPVIDTQGVNTYTREQRYQYRADGVYAQDEKQIFNVVEPLTGLKFYNDTRYGLTGNIVIPCGYNIGSWDVVVERTDVVSPSFSTTAVVFNEDHTVFVVEGLLPGHYKVYLTNQIDPSIEIESGVLDITRGWVAQEFEYRSDMSLEMQVVAVVDGEEQLEAGDQPVLSLSTVPYDMANYCSDTYIMESGRGYVVTVDVFEQYGTDKCYVSGVDYNIGGDLAHIMARTAGSGRDTLLIKALEPNFIAPYKRSLQLTASHDNRNQQQNLDAYITGAKQFESDFTLLPPTIVAVVHDPPGDGSFASLSQGTSFSFSESFTIGSGGDISVDVSTGADMEHYQGVFVGLGGGTILLNKAIDSEASALFQAGLSYHGNNTNSSSYEIALDQTISTASDGVLPGYPSDVYVGYSPIIHMGAGKRLRMEGCTPVSEDVTDVIRPDRTPLFSLTHQHVKDVTVPNLEILRDATTNPDTIQMYQNSIDGWLDILAENEANWGNAQDLPVFQLRNTETGQLLSFENSIAFSGGQIISYSLSDRNSDGSSFGGGITASLSKTTNKSFTVFGTFVSLEINSKRFQDFSYNQGGAQSDGKSFEFTLSDDDIGDQFDVLIRKDTTYAFATPIFKAVAGRSMCPVERNTQPREGVQITSDKAVGFANLDDPAAFSLSLANTQVADEEAGNGYQKSFRIKVHDSKGAIVRYNGGLLNESGQLVVLDTQGPEAIKDSIPLTIERNPATPEVVNFEDVSIVFFSECEENSGSLGFYDGFAGVQLKDTLKLSAYFHQPCVEAINVSSPTPNWVVNQTSNNELHFTFSIDNPETSFDKLLVEYANQGSNIPQLLQEINSATLTPDATGNYNITVDVSGITDGQYQFRLSPRCDSGSESWMKQTSSDWVSGSIYRSDPLITEVYPPDNSVMTAGIISASYDRDLSPAGVNSLNISLRGILGGYEYIPKSAEFNHIDDLITIPHQPAIALDSAFTVEFWLHPSAFANNGDKVPLIEKGGQGIYLTSEGEIDNTKVVSSQVLTISKWTHVAVVYDGATTVKTYFDSQLVAEDTAIVPYDFTGAAPLTIGAAYLDDAFSGQIDEVRIWSTARSVAEITTYRSERLLGNEDGLMAYYVLDDIALEGEGIRDFTGKTSGTIATDISWIQGDDAAPIVVEKVIQDVPIDAILSGGNQILIVPKSNFPEHYIEGAELTAFIADDVVEDLYGNPAAGASWSFIVDKNEVQWAQNNLLVNHNEGIASNFDMEITNSRIQDVTYIFEDIDGNSYLPVWLSVSNDPGSGILEAGFTHNISFEVAEWLNPGIHQTYVKATIMGPEGILGVESFFLEVNVSCEEPAYSIDPAQYPDQVTLTATLNIAGEYSQDENDRVYAYLSGELRGIGELSLTGGQHLVNMIIYGHFGDNGTLDFRVWDASDCKEYQGVLEAHPYQGGVNIGSLGNPVSLTTGEVLSKSISLPTGFHWVSFNLSDPGQPALSLSAVTGFSTGDQITDQQGVTITYDQATDWSAGLTTLDSREHYSVYLTQGTTLYFQGIEVSENTNIDIVSGSNWAGYIPDKMKRTGRALISLANTEATNGDQVEGREGFAEFLDGEWIGTLTHLTPGRGYRITSAQASTLNYFGVADDGSKGVSTVKGAPVTQAPMFELKDRAGQNGWAVDSHSYPEVMYISGVIEATDNRFDPEKEHIIAAFEGEICKGVAIPQRIDGSLHYFMTLYGDTDREQLSFKLMDSDTEEVYALSNVLEFSPSQSIGTYNEPYKWELAKQEQQQSETADTLLGYKLHQSWPNPVGEFTTISYQIPQTSQIDISIYDITGRKLKTLVKQNQQRGRYQLQWFGDDDRGARLAAGVYIIRMITPEKNLQHKVILK